MNIFSEYSNIPDELLASIIAFEAKSDSKREGSAFNKYIDFGNTIFQLTDIEQADFTVLPVNWEVYKKNGFDFSELLEVINRYRKRLLLFYWSDSDDEISLENSIVFRTSLYKSNQKKNTFAMPCWKDDLLEASYRGKLQLRKKSHKPSIGFRGQAEPFKLGKKEHLKKEINKSFKKLGIPFQKQEYWCKGHQIRTKAMKAIQKNSKLISDFQVTNAFGGDTNINLKENQQLFINNIFDNDYNLCVRGGGNYSYRLYEVISAGRIPVFVNTDCVLPYDFKFDWKELCVWVEEDEIQYIDEKILTFHHSLSDQSFKELQHEIRILWDEWISPYGFFKNLHNHF